MGVEVCIGRLLKLPRRRVRRLFRVVSGANGGVCCVSRPHHNTRKGAPVAPCPADHSHRGISSNVARKVTELIDCSALLSSAARLEHISVKPTAASNIAMVGQK